MANATPLRAKAGQFQGSLKFGKDRPQPWLETGMTMDVDTEAVATVSMEFAPGQERYVIDVVKVQPYNANAILHVNGFTDGAGLIEFEVIFLADGRISAVNVFDAGTLVQRTEAAGVDSAFDGLARHVRFEAFQDGAAVSWLVYVDGELVNFNTEAGRTLTPAERVSLLRSSPVPPLSEDPSGPVTWAHLAIWQGSAVADLGEAVDAFRGHADEPAGRRLERLCREEGIPFTWQ